MTREWKTTRSSRVNWDWMPEPEPPSGEGWRLVGGSVLAMGSDPRSMSVVHFWFWEREVSS